MSVPPFLSRRHSTPGIMTTVLVALAPATAVQLWLGGFAWALTLLVSCALALLLEASIAHLRGRNIGHHLRDGSVLVSSVLLLLLLPPAVPWWLAAAGISVAVIGGKHIFGGLGQNLFNPVLVGYLGLSALFPETIAVYESEALRDFQTLPVVALTLALAAGGFFMLLRRVIGWQIPMTMLLASALQIYMMNMVAASNIALLAAFFLATDPVTSPGTRRGKLVYGLLTGLTIMIMTRWLTYPTAVASAILIMNATVPIMDQLIKHDRKRLRNLEPSK